MSNWSLIVAFVLFSGSFLVSLAAEEGKTVAKSAKMLAPRVTVVQEKRGERNFTLARIAVPTIPDFECDIWCYEDAFGHGEGLPQEDGSMIIKHKRRGKDGDIKATTHLVPSVGAVDFVVTIEAKTKRDVLSVCSVNPCWQLQRAAGFKHQGGFVKDFVNRCFVYTVKGFTLLGETTRFPDTRRPATDRTNSPPWVQIYPPIWARHGGQPKAFWGNSTDRPVCSIIGEVSRDGKYLTAFAWRKSRSLCQGWHDCMHVSPDLRIDYDESKNQIVSRGKLYFIENDPEKLLRLYKKDFQIEETVLVVRRKAGRLLVASNDLPGHEIELQLPQMVEAIARPLRTAGIDVGPPKKTTWQEQWYGTFTSAGRSASGQYYVWARPYEDRVNVYLSVRNETKKKFDAQVSAALRFRGRQVDKKAAWGKLLSTKSANGEWIAAFAWEYPAEGGATVSDIELVRYPGVLSDVAQAETKTIRGRLYLMRSTRSALTKLHQDDMAEWRRAVPFSMSIPEGD